MKTKLLSTLLLFTIISVAFFACKKDCNDLEVTPVKLELPETPYDYSVNTGINSQIAAVGRVLFYDNHLSVNNSISCGSCHKQTIAFSDNVVFSPGFENHKTLRNTLPIQNLSLNNFFPNNGFGTSMFWDGRATFLPTMVLMPITNHVEMGMSNNDDIVEKVKNLPYYNELFTTAYGTGEITLQKIGESLSAFVGAIFSGNTLFDKYNSQLAQLSGIENEGRLLFFNKYNCNSCHQTQQFNGYEMGGGFVNIGLDEVYTDQGHENVTHMQGDVGKFKIPNLRNIALTAPYMHDGRFSNLNEVIDHYSNGIKDHPALDPRLRDTNGHAAKLNITESEKAALIAFLNTLTDYSMITDPKFSNPFRIN